MKRSIIFLRHAKSDWDVNFLSDHERPLSSRGKKAAKAIGRFLTQTGQVPDRIVTSSAVRASRTVDLAAKTGKWECEIERTDFLYQSDSADVLHLIRAQSDEVGILLVAGHEPTWSSLVSKLTNGGRVRFPTGTAARIDFEASSWADVQFGLGSLIWLVPPRLLTDGTLALR